MRRKFAPHEAGAGGARRGRAARHHHRAGPAAVRADRGRRLHPGRLPRARGAGALEAGARPAGRSTSSLSDMAPNLSGIAASDAARMADLVELAIDFARTPPEAAKARWSARSFTAAATASSSSASRRPFGSSSRSSPRRRGTSRPRPSWSASASSRSRSGSRYPERSAAHALRMSAATGRRGLAWTKIGRRCRECERQSVRVARFCPWNWSRGEQSMVLEGRGLAGDRAGAVHRLQAVRPQRRAGAAMIGYSDFLEEVRGKRIK